MDWGHFLPTVNMISIILEYQFCYIIPLYSAKSAFCLQRLVEMSRQSAALYFITIFLLHYLRTVMHKKAFLIWTCRWYLLISIGSQIHSSPLVRSTFCPTEIDHISGVTLYPGYWPVQESWIGTHQKLTLYDKRPYIRGPYKRARVYL